jgi:Uma2 family endonuclease
MATMTHPALPGPPIAPGVVFQGATWDDYEAMLRIVGDRPIRVTYDQGTMEVFMPSLGHEGDSYLLGRMVDALTEEFEIPVEGGGTTTHRRQDLAKGAEPDACYWFHDKADRIRGKRELDLSVDPAPDLVIEVDVTSNSLDRLAIFAALGVIEVWRSDGDDFQFLQLGADGSYQSSETSVHFHGLPRDLIARYLAAGRSAEKTAWIRSFRAEVRRLR